MTGNRAVAHPPLFEEDLAHILHCTTRELWSAFTGKRVLLTGGTGFIGSWLVESLLFASARFNLNTQVVLLTRNAARFRAIRPHLANHPAVTLHEGDVRSFLFPDEPCEMIIHGAADSGSNLGTIAPGEMLSTIVKGTERVLEFAVACGCQKLLFLSSGAIYGQQPADLQRISEDHSCSLDLSLPASSYAEAKRLGEVMCINTVALHRFDITIARCFSFVGPYIPLDVHFAVGNFVRDLIKGGPIVVHSDGSAIRSYLAAADLAIWLWTILLRGTSGRAYNVGSEHEISIRELAERLAGQDNVIIKGAPAPSQSPRRYVPSTLLAREELGLSERIRIDDALRSTIRWSRAMFEQNGAP